MHKKLNVYFTCPTDLIVSNIDLYQKLVKYIRNQGVAITYDWVEEAYKDLKSGKTSESDFNALKIKGIQESDLVIAEMSKKSVGVVHQITIALQKTKPVLLLIPKSEREDEIKAIKSEWLVQQKYENLNSAKKTILDFIEAYSNNKKIRINLVISAYENKYLLSEMNKSKKSKTEIIRYLIKNEADKTLNSN